MPTYRALRYEQPGGVFYACVVRAKDIIRRLEVKRRSDDPASGVQRDENDGRVKDIANYLKHPDAVLPTPIIVSAAEAVSVHGENITITSEQSIVGHILDGQHRVLGLRLLEDAELDRIELLVVFVFEIDAFSEATIFTTINSNQKQVSKSLIYDLFGLNPKRSVQKSGHEIAKSLNDDAESPFYRRIKLLGNKVEDTETLSQAAFIDRLLDAMRGKNSLFMHYYDKGEDWAIRKIISNAFIGINDALSEVENQYQPDFFLKTTGYGGVLKAMNSMVEFGRIRSTLKPDLFKEIFVRYLEKFPTPPAAGTGNSAMLGIRDAIQATLAELSPGDQGAQSNPSEKGGRG